jgi:hypothetical protein
MEFWKEAQAFNYGTLVLPKNFPSQDGMTKSGQPRLIP